MSAEGSRSALAEVDKKGAFIRKDSTFRDIIKEGGKFPPEAGRYHLYISLACPWAHRCYIVRSMKVSLLGGVAQLGSVSVPVVVHDTISRGHRALKTSLACRLYIQRGSIQRKKLTTIVDGCSGTQNLSPCQIQTYASSRKCSICAIRRGLRRVRTTGLW
eukprot:scaffold1558_cov403-Prasinococcus_capsulatus_cf.AAC.31